MKRHLRLAAIRRNGAEIAEMVSTEPDTPVPSCPGWVLRDLGVHVATVMDMWRANLVRASTERPPWGLDPPDDADLAAFVVHHVSAVIDSLEHTPEDSPAWTWWGDDTAQGIARRVQHETGIHRWDAARTLGAPSPMPPEEAADGIEEFFTQIIPLTEEPPRDLAGVVSVEATDVDRRWTVRLEADRRPRLVDDTAPDVALRGSSSDLLLVLWRRLPLETIEVAEDGDLAARLLAYPRL